MNILLLDNDEAIQQALDCFQEMINELKYFKVKNSDITGLNDENIDLIIADFANESSLKLLNNILSKNPKINTIITSDKLTNCVNSSCDYCEEIHNRRRLIKPIEPKKFLDLIQSFHQGNCDYFDVFDDITSILSHIIKRFSSLEYEEHTKTVLVDNSCSTSRNTFEVVSLIYILEQNSIQYSVLDEYRIKIG